MRRELPWASSSGPIYKQNQYELRESEQRSGGTAKVPVARDVEEFEHLGERVGGVAERDELTCE